MLLEPLPTPGIICPFSILKKDNKAAVINEWDIFQIKWRPQNISKERIGYQKAIFNLKIVKFILIHGGNLWQ